MKTNILIKVGKAIAIAITILGIIHDVATYTPIISNGLSCLNPVNLKAMIYMSLLCGTSFILSGILLIMLLNKIAQYTFLYSIVFVIALYLAISGILSVIYMFNNPFAWIALFLNLTMFTIAILLKTKLFKN